MLVYIFSKSQLITVTMYYLLFQTEFRREIGPVSGGRAECREHGRPVPIYPERFTDVLW